MTNRRQLPIRYRTSQPTDQPTIHLLTNQMQVDPFDPDSPIKKNSIEYFPPDMFFVLRVVQLLRGISQGDSVRGWRNTTPNPHSIASKTTQPADHRTPTKTHV